MQPPGPAGWLPWNDDGWKSPAWNWDPPPPLGQCLRAGTAACTSLPAHSPGCQHFWEPEHRTGMDTEQRWLWDGLFCLSAVEQLGPLWMQSFTSCRVTKNLGHGVVQAACSP